jgi:hypothetical protein
MAGAAFRSGLVDGLWIDCLRDQCVAQERLARSIVRSFVLMLYGKCVIYGWALQYEASSLIRY